MRVDDFDYGLDDSRIALRPLEPRESARLLVSTPEAMSDKTIGDLPALLNANDLLVFNNTRVIPARLYGMRGAAKIELLLHRARPDGLWEAFARPMKRLHTNDRIMFAPDFYADVLGRHEDRVVLRFYATPGSSVQQGFEKYGHMPLPPYIKRDDDSTDRHDYQTVFAAKDGAVAAPTASLHFTDALMQRLPCPHTFVTLHVGAGTFQPVRVDDTKDHVMHSEWAELTPETADAIAACKARGGRVVAVGTTSLRTLEASGGKPFAGDTDIFITPGYRFKVVDALMTNFHLPRSTLLMLVAAFVGMERMRTIYNHAIAQNYRFYSYGDSSLLFPEPHP